MQLVAGRAGTQSCAPSHHAVLTLIYLDPQAISSCTHWFGGRREGVKGLYLVTNNPEQLVTHSYKMSQFNQCPLFQTSLCTEFSCPVYVIVMIHIILLYILFSIHIMIFL